MCIRDRYYIMYASCGSCSVLFSYNHIPTKNINLCIFYRSVLSNAPRWQGNAASMDTVAGEYIPVPVMQENGGCGVSSAEPVSYTHLDVYKRQPAVPPGMTEPRHDRHACRDGFFILRMFAGLSCTAISWTFSVGFYIFVEFL